MKKNVLVIYGGKTVEHDISVITGVQAMLNAPSEFNIIPIYINNDGVWYTGKNFDDIHIYTNFDTAKSIKVAVLPYANMLYKFKGKVLKPYINVDSAILAMHGMNGEDGTLQGLLTLAGIPYTSSECLGAACAMDKVVMKMIFQSCGLKILPYEWFLREEYLMHGEELLKSAEEKIKFPIIVKPSNLGSSIGITIANNHDELKEAVSVACEYDGRIILERALTNFKEINCSALGTSDSVEASQCEQPVNWKNFLTFKDKYMNGDGKNKGMHRLSRILPAEISDETKKLIQDSTLTVFRAFECKGVVRVDYLIDNDTDTVYINEINTIPGSLAFYLWEDKFNFTALIKKLVEIAEKAHLNKNKNEYAYKSDVLKKFNNKTK